MTSRNYSKAVEIKHVYSQSSCKAVGIIIKKMKERVVQRGDNKKPWRAFAQRNARIGIW